MKALKSQQLQLLRQAFLPLSLILPVDPIEDIGHILKVYFQRFQLDKALNFIINSGKTDFAIHDIL